ncbi:ABC transporter substrate-binding protein [Acinetobacter qingfengensis]|uniref:Putative aliphatic sulfonates-binding protein n=2 Tax=Acinetobacter qingfengensis TaxID=1262585 RepID=A0A1E7QWF8_9GAMM|nr:ABC transporter substrate-binding protein [Acinetobacter qingfengensis]OEY91440.1 sulfonate ABC transporter substrate-binding protein [Acinetobacter qingfengensis]
MKKKTITIVGVILTTLTLTACSKKDETHTAASQDKENRSEIVLRIGDQKGNMRAQLEASGVLKGIDYKINWYEFPAAAPVAEALKVDGIDLGYLGDAPFLFANANGGTAKAIAVYKSDPYPVALLVRNDSSIQSAKDLKGKTVTANQGSIGQLVTLRAVEQAGLKATDVKFRFLPPADGKLAVANGSVDVWAVWDPYTAYAELKDHFRIIANGRGLYSGYTFLAATDKSLQEQQKRKSIQDFIYRLKQSQEWATQNADEFGQEYAKITGLPEDVGKLAFKRRNASWEPIDADVIKTSQETADFYTKHKLIKQQFNVSNSFDTSFKVK